MGIHRRSMTQRRILQAVATVALILLAAIAAAMPAASCRKPPAPAKPGPSGETPGTRAPELGRPAPDFELPSAWGGRKSLGDFRGKAVLLNFWSTGCPYCVREMPDLQAVHQEASRDRVVVTVNVGDTAEKVASFLKERNLTFETLLDDSGSVARLYRVMGIPCFFAIDKEGIVRARRDGAIPKAEMKKLLDEAAEAG